MERFMMWVVGSILAFVTVLLIWAAYDSIGRPMIPVTTPIYRCEGARDE